jgi:hypothetical protein
VAKCHRDQVKVANLKRINNQLMVDILCEKRASNKIIDDIIIDAHWVSSEALEMMSQANEKSAKAEEHTINERKRASAQLHKERAHNSRESARLWQKLVTTIKKVNREHESSINLFKLKSDKKYDKARSDVVTISTKLKEQHFIWHTRLCDIDSSSKSLVSKERARRRHAVQQQLDRTSAMESQLQEIIEGLGIMNYELVDEVKNSNSAKRTAIKLYEKSKEVATRRLGHCGRRKSRRMN